jgi:hypothetical protein
MSKKRIISLELQTAKFENAISKLIRATGKNTAEVLADGAVEFADFAAKYTMPDEGKKFITKKRYKREISEVVSRRKQGKKRIKKIFAIAIKRRGKTKIVRYANTVSKLKKYQRIDYRGLGRAAWFLNIPNSLRKPLTSAESKLLSMSPKLWSKSSLNEVKLTPNRVTITNNAPEIQNYARIALAQGYKAAARKMDRTRMDFLKKQASGRI